MDKFGAMKVFIAVSEAGSLSSAAHRLGMSLTSVSRQLLILENSLKVRLINRTTRHCELTESGRLYLEAARQILENLEGIENGLAAKATSAIGRLHISSPGLIGRARLVPLLQTFLVKHPQLAIDITFTDRSVRLVEEGIDIAFYIGHLKDSGLIARKLNDIRLIVCASPKYILRRSEPKSPESLKGHDCLTFGDVPGVGDWSFQQNGMRKSVKIIPRVSANDLDSLVHMAVQGVGIIRVPDWRARDHLASGRLQRLLKDYERPPVPLNILFAGNRLLPPKVRLFADYVQKNWK